MVLLFNCRLKEIRGEERENGGLEELGLIEGSCSLYNKFCDITEHAQIK